MLERPVGKLKTGGLGGPIGDEVRLFSNTINSDNRGEFTRIYDFQDLSENYQIIERPLQLSYSYNKVAGTRRGLHVRAIPANESKIVRVVRGAIFDVVVDCRPQSPSFGSWMSFLLDAREGTGLFVPAGFAHGIQALEDDAMIIYSMNQCFDASLDVAIDTNDSELAIEWPSPASAQSPKDMAAQPWSSFIKVFNS